MKVVRSVRLWFREGTSDKVYEVDLVDLERTPDDQRYLVNFRYGRRGATLRDGTKTASPVGLDKAERLYDSVVVSKINEGYRRTGDDAAPAAASGSTSDSPAGSELDGRSAELLRQLAACLREPWPEKKRDRLFWRLGVIRLQAATPQLAAMAEKLTPAGASYSLVHALARCGGADAVDILRQIADVNVSHVTRDYAAYALTSDLMGTKRQTPRLALPQTLNINNANEVDAAMAAADGPALVQALVAISAEQPGFANQYLIALAHRAHADPAARAALLAALRAVKARPPFVQVLRRLFKYADLTDDGALFAATARQFELAQPMYSRRSIRRGKVWINEMRASVQLNEEQGSATPRIALSDQTLLYFKRRAWRTLRKRAELGQDAYTAMAGELLLAFTDADGDAPRQWNGYARIDGRYQSYPRSSDALRRVWSVSHVLHAAASTSVFNANALTHRHDGAISPSQRGEAFADLWDAQPERLLRIAGHARNRPTALFAVKALTQGPARPEALEAAAITDLLGSPYAEVGQLALSIARRLVDAGKADGPLVMALLGAALPELRELGTKAIDTRTEWPWSDTPLALATITSAHEHVRLSAQRWLGERPPTQHQRAQLTQAFATWLSRLPAELDTAQRDGLRFVVSLLPLLWPAHDCSLAPEEIEALTGHACPDVQAASIQLLAVTSIRPEDLPEPFWNAILQASAPEIRAAAMILLGRLDPASLADHQQTVLLAATSTHADLRAAARPLVVRLATANADFAAQLRDILMTALFHAEPAEGHAADMVRLFVDSLPQALAAIDTGTLWRLLQAKANGARFLGTRVLETSDPARLSVKQIARLGNHPFAAVRRWALRAFESDEARFRGAPEDAVLLVESEWEDVRSAAIARFTAWPADALPSAALAVMADSNLPAVQDGARQLLRRRLADEDAGPVLSRVLEHPSGNFHLFVTELITDQVLADPGVFDKFLIQARIILMQINRGRIAKDRVFAALRREALARQDRAVAIWRLLHDLTLSAIARDKAPALLILRDIAHAWPDITLPIGVTPAQLRDGAQRRGGAA